MNPILLLACGIGLAFANGCKDNCEAPLQTNDVVEVTVIAPIEVLSTGCPQRLVPQPGDHFVVQAGRSGPSVGSCTGVALEGDRPSFVPEEYETHCVGRISNLITCDPISEEICASAVDISIDSPPSNTAPGTITITSSQCLGDAGVCARCDLDALCSDVYSANIRLLNR